ncbi:unnamed protein product [Closterium sp. Naga37s-1]|nr:unnamed protein product [Closterium sp. Naga37s-1]
MLAHYITEGLLCVPRVIASHHLLLNLLGLLHSVRAACRDLLLLPVQGSLHAGPHGLLLGVGRGGLAAWRHVSQWTVASLSGFSSSVGRLVRRAYLGERGGGSRGLVGEGGHRSGTGGAHGNRRGAAGGSGNLCRTSGGGGAAATGSSGGGRGGGGVHGGMGLAVGHHRHEQQHRTESICQITGSSGHSESGAGNEVRWQHGAAAAQHMTGSTRARSTGSAAEADGAGVEGAGALLAAEGREAGAATFTGEAGSGRGMGGSTTGWEGRCREGEGPQVSLVWQVQQMGVRCAASRFMPPLWPPRPQAL